MSKSGVHDDLRAYNAHWSSKFRCPSQGGVTRRSGKHRNRSTADISSGKKK